MSLEARIADEVRALEGLDLHGLRKVWRRRYGAPPRLRAPDLLARMLSWRMQVEVAGGLDHETVRRLRRGTADLPQTPEFRPGVRLARDWKGRRCEVEVVEGGYLWNGTTYRSLSAAACAITGSKWNGRKFFGLDREPSA